MAVILSYACPLFLFAPLVGLDGLFFRNRASTTVHISSVMFCVLGAALNYCLSGHRDCRAQDGADPHVDVEFHTLKPPITLLDCHVL